MLGVAVSLFVITGALWLGGFIPTLQASGAKFTKHRLMNAGFVVRYVDVVGEGRISEEQVRNALGVRSGDYLFDMDIKNAQARVQSLNWVDTAIVRRLWPNRVVVHVNERIPYALWQENGAFKLVDASGVNIAVQDMAEFSRLPLIVGTGAEQNAHAFLTQLNQYEVLRNRVDSVVYVNQRRWDILLADGALRVLLPEENLGKALASLAEYHQKHGVLDLNLERIDMRVEGRLYLRPIVSARKQTKRGKRA